MDIDRRGFVSAVCSNDYRQLTSLIFRPQKLVFLLFGYPLFWSVAVAIPITSGNLLFLSMASGGQLHHPIATTNDVL